ncbi:hypothetical protein ACPF7I_06245 [Anoxybacillus sp. D401a]|uniref:hypothetical protein n=1 Tax=Anoxybacillus sp. D401a TaxID=575112 RepID=UPI003D3319B9
MSINYKFNEWRVSGEKATAWSQKAYKLLRVNADKSCVMSAHSVGTILYLHYVKGLTAQEIKKHSAGKMLLMTTIKGILRGSHSPEVYCIFQDMLETEPEMLDRLFESA